MNGKTAGGYESSVEVKVHSISASNSVNEKEPARWIGFSAVSCVGKNKQQGAVIIECIKGILNAFN